MWHAGRLGGFWQLIVSSQSLNPRICEVRVLKLTKHHLGCLFWNVRGGGGVKSGPWAPSRKNSNRNPIDMDARGNVLLCALEVYYITVWQLPLVSPHCSPGNQRGGGSLFSEAVR